MQQALLRMLGYSEGAYGGDCGLSACGCGCRYCSLWDREAAAGARDGGRGESSAKGWKTIAGIIFIPSMPVFGKAGSVSSSGRGRCSSHGRGRRCRGRRRCAIGTVCQQRNKPKMDKTCYYVNGVTVVTVIVVAGIWMNELQNETASLLTAGPRKARSTTSFLQLLLFRSSMTAALAVTRRLRATMEWKRMMSCD